MNYILLVSTEKQGNLCFEEIYGRVSWDDVMESWHKKIIEILIALNPETLTIFRESVNPNEFTYKNRLKKWLIESPTINTALPTSSRQKTTIIFYLRNQTYL